MEAHVPGIAVSVGVGQLDPLYPRGEGEGEGADTGMVETSQNQRRKKEPGGAAENHQMK